MKNILITGCTDTHVNRFDRVPDVQFASTPALLAKLINEELGYSVTHRTAENEDLDRYDAVICFLYPKTKHARHVENAEFILHERPDAIIGVDDWSLPQLPSQWPQMAGRGVIAPMFSWGDKPLLARFLKMNPRDLVTVDLSCYLHLVKAPGPWPRPRCWVNASYHPHNHIWAAYHTHWPVASYGCKELCQPRILEAELACDHYMRAAGVLVPPYDISGTGWWRPRILQAVAAGAVIGGIRAETCNILAINDITIDVGAVENLSDRELEQLADEQRATLLSAIPSANAVAEPISNILE